MQLGDPGRKFWKTIKTATRRKNLLTIELYSRYYPEGNEGKRADSAWRIAPFASVRATLGESLDYEPLIGRQTRNGGGAEGDYWVCGGQPHVILWTMKRYH